MRACHSPERIKRSASPIRRRTAIASAIVSSATASAGVSGVR